MYKQIIDLLSFRRRARLHGDSIDLYRAWA